MGEARQPMSSGFPKLITVLLRLIAVLLSFCFALRSSGQAQVQPRRVLILNEVGTAWPGINLIDHGISAALDTSPYKLEFYREYMDAILFPDPVDQQRFRKFFIRKYQNRRPDIIITVGPSPLKFMVEMHDKAFPGVPIVFCLPNWAPGTPARVNFTGVQNEISPVETLEAAIHLKPVTKHVLVVAGTSLVDATYTNVVKQKLRPYEAKYGIAYLTNVTMPDLVDRLKHLPRETIVLFTSFSQDAAGSRFTTGGASAIVAAAANVPIFALGDASINHGEVGGKLSLLHEQGRLAGELAVRILQGAPPNEVARVTAGTTYMFDWRALRRWGFEESHLPPGSIVLNRRATLWDSYKWYVIGGISLIVFEALLIFGLLWQRTRRRNAESQLSVTNDRLRTAIEGGRFVGWDFDVNTGQNQWFGDLHGVFGIASKTYAAHDGEFRKRVHPDDLDAVMHALQRAQKNREPYVAEFRIIRNDGEVRWILARGKFHHAVNGRPERMLGLAVDVTERKLAEQALADVSRRLIQAQEQERMRIARELHDDINQQISILAVDLNRLGQQPPESTARLKSIFDEVALRLSDIIGEVQAISHRLHSSKLEYVGLLAACKGFCKEAAERQSVNIEFRADGVPSGVPQDVSLTIFRVLQESLQNAIKHSGAQHFAVQLRGLCGDLQLTVQDDGIGFDVVRATSNHGIGLISMRERVNLVKGAISITSQPGAGTEVNIRVPMSATHRSHEAASEVA
jgi:signal transduction histidine kinase/ABC-type uncharacterized transport system substrate-binding protein